MQDLKTLLLNPFPQRISPYAALLQEKSEQWINEEYCRLPLSFREMLKKLNPGYWAANCWPDAPLTLLETFTRVLLWGVAYDDYYAPLQADELSKVIDRSMKIAEGAETIPDENPLLHVLSTNMRQFESVATEGWVKRYVYNLSQFFEGLMIDSGISYRKEVKYPSIKDYITIRRKAMGSPNICDKIELVTGILPDFIIVHPFLQQARMIAGDLMGWENDLVSVEKEQEDNEALNLVLVIKNERNCSVKEAYTEAIQMYNTHMEEYLLLYNDVPDFGIYTPSVKKFLEGQGLWLTGQVNWFNYTKRFKSANDSV